MNNNPVDVHFGNGVGSFPLEVIVGVHATHGTGSASPTKSSDVRYQFQLTDTRRGTALSISERSGSLVKQVNEGVVALTDTVRRQVANVTNSEYHYDLRALFFVLGELCGRTLKGRDWPDDVSTIKSCIPYATRMGVNSLLLLPVNDGVRIMTYMMSLTSKMCDVDTLHIGAEQYQAARPPRNDVEKRRYINNIMRALQADVINQGVYGEHMFAFFRGLGTWLTLRSHSQEGGWVRDPIASAEYPRPRGFISTPVSEVTQFPRFYKTVTNSELFLNDIISHFLECAACVADSDPASEHQLTSVYTNSCYEDEDTVSAEFRDNGDYQRPSAVPELKDVLDIFENHCISIITKTDLGTPSDGHVATLPRNTFRPYFVQDQVDTHIGRSSILPYAFVENGVLLKHESTVKADGPKAGRKVELSLFGSEARVSAVHTDRVTASGHHLAPKVYFDYRDQGLRQLGATYMGSAPFGSAAFTEARIITPAGNAPDMILCRDDQTTLASSHWVRPHCGVPMPGECSIWNGRAIIEVTTSRGSDLRTGLAEVVTVEVGEPTARSVAALTGGDLVIRRNVNNYYRTVMNISELSTDEAIQEEMFEAMDDHLPIRRRFGDPGFVGLPEVNDEPDDVLGPDPDRAAEHATPHREEEGDAEADTPDDEVEEGDVGAE